MGIKEKIVSWVGMIITYHTAIRMSEVKKKKRGNFKHLFLEIIWYQLINAFKFLFLFNLNIYSQIISEEKNEL